MEETDRIWGQDNNGSAGNGDGTGYGDGNAYGWGDQYGEGYGSGCFAGDGEDNGEGIGVDKKDWDQMKFLKRVPALITEIRKASQ